MNTVIEQMIRKYNPVTIYDRKNAMKEVIQEIVLCGLSRADFFERAAFYGGTALRVFYGLDRFSEDLDFSLREPDSDFVLSSYFPILRKEAEAFGLKVDISEKAKTTKSNIHSAFLKGNTREHLLKFYADDSLSLGVAANEMIKIKFEIDTDPPVGAGFEHRYRLQPAPYEVMMYDAPSLFAGKLHAVICRAWQSRVKGRDLYDYVFYLSQAIPVNKEHLRARLIQTGYIEDSAECSEDDIKAMLFEKFDTIDYEQAKEDVLPFIRDSSSLRLWNKEFFRQITETLRAV